MTSATNLNAIDESRACVRRIKKYGDLLDRFGPHMYGCFTSSMLWMEIVAWDLEHMLQYIGHTCG